MSNDQIHTFTADEAGVELGPHQGRYSQLTIGQVGNADFGTGTLLIQKKTLGGGVHTVRSITAAQYAALQDKTVRLELPNGTAIVVEVTGATSPDLYVEHRNQEDR